LPLADRVLLIATYWRTNPTLRQVAPLFGISKSAADRILDHLAPLMAISPTHRPRKDTVYIGDGTLVPTRDRSISASSKNYRYSMNLQVVIDANSRLVVAIGLPAARQPQRLPGVHRIRRRPGQSRSSDHRRRRLPGHRCAHPAPQTARPTAPECRAGGREQGSPLSTRPRRARRPVRLKNWKILRDRRLKGNGVHQATLSIARLHNLALTG
jgi:hypothetical protein